MSIPTVISFAMRSVYSAGAAPAASAARTSSWRIPFVETALPPSAVRFPARSVNRPPASSTMTSSGARSHSATTGSAAMSAAPSATRM